MRKPNFLIIGTARSGTTSLWYYLRQHPEIYMSPIKEPGFFIFEGKDRILTLKGWRTLPPYSQDWEAYCSLFSGAKIEKILGEATPGYLYYPWVPERIHARLPNVKMVAILRNPVERAYSLYLLHVRDGKETAKSFEEALALEEERMSKGYYFGHYKTGGLYYEQLQRYFRFFSKEQIKVFLYEDLCSDVRAVLKAIYEFLEVDPTFQADTSVKLNPGVGHRRQHSALCVIQFLARHSIIKGVLPQRLRWKLRAKLKEWRMRSIKPSPKPPLDPEIREQLIEYYRNDILKLQDLIGRDLSHWLVLEPKDDLEPLLDRVMSVEGQISRAEAKQLIKLARETPPDTVIVEIGTYRGRSAIALALGSRLGNSNRIYAIDPHEQFEGVCGGQFGPEDQDALYRNLAKAGVGDLVSVIGLPSTLAARAWIKRNISLLWIDGDHRYEAVRADYEAWKRFVMPRGTVAFHDIKTPGVQQLIRELVNAGELEPVGEIDSLAWFRLRKQYA